MSYKVSIALLIAGAMFQVHAAQRYEVTGLVLRVDAPHKTVLVSHDAIPGYMDAMTMPYSVRDPHLLDHLEPGQKIGFTLVVTKDSSWLEGIHVVPYQSMDRDPFATKRLQILDAVLQPGAPPQLKPGQKVPDFSLLDQMSRTVRLSQFEGKVVAMTFIYTRCPLPDYCFRLSNNFRRVEQRFSKRLGTDLELLSVTFDPVHDTPDVLAKYAEVWKAEGDGWRFLTGPLPDVKQVCSRFGMSFWPDEGALTHSLHTVVIDRRGRLVANIEGNQFTAEQLGDLVEATLDEKPATVSAAHSAPAGRLDRDRVP
jgi:protein SCO1/2